MDKKERIESLESEVAWLRWSVFFLFLSLSVLMWEDELDTAIAFIKDRVGVING